MTTVPGRVVVNRAWRDDPWVFAYGSLIWDPGFPCGATYPALLRGYRRSLCILSIRNRGTEDRPGLVLGLERGGSCAGRALRIAAAERIEATLDYLERREMATASYSPRILPVRLRGTGERAGELVHALTFVADPGHRQYVRGIPPAEAAALVRQGMGAYGRSLDYLRNVVEHLDATGISDGPLHRILALAERGGGEPRQP